ncbi:MAG: SHOCT domain-containing protein [Eubacteriaceae bacterium]|nr:SHOCT domain-containing protein [Eubacteriaceae bacterium]
MGIIKVKCINCNKEIIVNKYKTADGWICGKCFSLSGYNIINALKKTKEQVRSDIELHSRLNNKNNFIISKKIGNYIEFDDINRQFRVFDGLNEIGIFIDSLLGEKKNSTIYSYDDIIEFELIEDGSTVTKGGLGRAVVFGALTGPAGAIVGEITGKKTTKSIINSLKIKITVNNFYKPAVYINLIDVKTKTNSIMYRSIYEITQQILSTFTLIIKQNELKKSNEISKEFKNNQYSAAEEIRKFKELLDEGIITQEEFDEKKKQLLNI